jgi:succinate dehydrogenase / fumarate reductase cytochrome b subunit
MMWLKDSSIGRKLVMSITGLALVFFLLFHGAMNLALVFSDEAYNWICNFLGASWYALIATVGLASFVVLHFVYALYLTIQNRLARGKDRYAVTGKRQGVDWESENMLVLGFVVIGFIVLHLANLWFRMQFTEIMHMCGVHFEVAFKDGVVYDPIDGAGLVKALFTTPIWGQVYCVLYLLWLVALWFHLRHGFWSALHTMGLNNLKWMKRVKAISTLLATLIVGLFATVVLYFFGVGVAELLAERAVAIEAVEVLQDSVQVLDSLQ